MPNNFSSPACRRVPLALAAVAGVLVLAACGSDATEQDASDTTAATAPSAASPTVSTTTPPPPPAPTTAAPEDTAPTTTPATVESPCRTITHELGESCVPADPQRIVALDPLTVLPTMLAVDAPVVGTVSVYDSGEPFVDYLDPVETAGIEIVGSFSGEANLEAIAALRPDLIVGSVARSADPYDELSAIAPTVVTGYAFYEADWRDEILLAADAAGRIDEAQAQLDELDARIDTVRTQLSQNAEPPTLTRVDLYLGTPLYYHFECVWFGDLLLSVGVQQPAAQQGDCEPGDFQSTIEYLSLETVDALDADAIIAYQQQFAPDDVGANPLTALEASPIWSTLDAVQTGNVYAFGDAWGLGGSIQSAHIVLDDVIELYGS